LLAGAIGATALNRVLEEAAATDRAKKVGSPRNRQTDGEPCETTPVEELPPP
jgi:hypothetical protein